MENDALEKGAAEEHDEPVAVERGFFTGSGDVIEIFDAITEVAPDGLEAVKQQQIKFRDAHVADVLKPFR